jgi:prepilin-type processing-associated H-X9-DG protein
MYKIIGADQKTYGPVSGDVIREWIASRRANASTRVQLEGSAEWKPLSEFSEFKDALTAVPPVPPLPPQAATSQVRTPPPPTSGMAIASLICGIFGCLGITALVGVVLGIISLIKINRSGGKLGGQPIAIAGLCVSALMLFAGLPMLAGLMFPALAKAKGRAQTVQCVNNLKQLALAARMYANDHGDKFPNATNWCDLIQSSAGSVKIFQCPASRGTLGGYGYNAALSGKRVDDVNPSTVLLFEIPGGWNVSGGPEQLIQTPRHTRQINVAFADGSVQQISTKDKLGTSWLRWEP